jgi:hypothetical protein
MAVCLNTSDSNERVLLMSVPEPHDKTFVERARRELEEAARRSREVVAGLDGQAEYPDSPHAAQ